MTVFQATQLILQQFPDLGSKQVVIELSEVQRMFVNETQLLQEKASAIPASLELDGGATLTLDLPGNPSLILMPNELALSCELPDEFLRINDIIMLDRNNAIFKNMVWDQAGQQLNFYDTTGFGVYKYPTEAIKTIFFYSKRPDVLSDENSSFGIPDEFTYAIVCGVLERHWAGKGILQNAGYYRSEYQRLRIEAKKYKNNSRNANYFTKSKMVS